MDVGRVNSVLAKAIMGLQEAEVQVMAEAVAVVSKESLQTKQDLHQLRKAIDALDDAQRRVFVMADVVAGAGSGDYEFAGRLRGARDALRYAQKVIQSGSMGESLRWRQDANAGWPDLKGLQFGYKRASAEAQKVAALAMRQVKPSLEVLNRVHSVFLRAGAAEALARKVAANRAARPTEYDVPSPLAMGFVPKPSKQWKKKKTKVGGTPMSVPVRGVWGVAKGPGGWIVFHVPSGQPVSTKLKGVRGQSFRTQQLAKLVADGWIQAFPEFLRAKPEQVKGLFQRHHEKMRQIAVDVADPGGQPLGYHSEPRASGVW